MVSSYLFIYLFILVYMSNLYVYKQHWHELAHIYLYSCTIIVNFFLSLRCYLLGLISYILNQGIEKAKKEPVLNGDPYYVDQVECQ